MASIGPNVPAHLRAPQSGPSTGPPAPPRYEEEEEDDDDAASYAPALPPALAAARAPAPKRTLGPAARGPLLQAQAQEEEEGSEDEDEIGPAPLPVRARADAEEDAVAEFMRKEAQRRAAIEEAARPKTLQREEWMLVPPTSSALLATLDPAKLSKPRQFSRSTAPPKVVDNTLWTETPAERQQRLADEVMGKKRRAENAEPDADATADAQKRRRRDAELARHVDEYTRKHRGTTLLDKHAQEDAKKDGAGGDEAAGIWDHARDMALGGRLMDDKDRRRIIQDAKGLSDRFGAGTSGGFL